MTSNTITYRNIDHLALNFLGEPLHIRLLLTNLCKEKGITLKQMCKELNINYMSLNVSLTNLTLHWMSILKMADFFNIDARYIFNSLLHHKAVEAQKAQKTN